jgi:hypothetical protein
MPQALIAAARRLADVLERENAALAAMDLRLAGTLVGEKTIAMTALAAFGDGAIVPRHPDLVSVAKSLDVLAGDNRRLLNRAMSAQQRVIGIVARAAAASVPHVSYGARGRMAHIARPMALSTRC